MNRLLVACFFVILIVGSAVSATTTSQIWYFDTDDPNPVPDFVDNPYEVPLTQISSGPGGSWASPGVWAISGEIDVLFQNSPISDELRITIELIWAPGQLVSYLPKRPGFFVSVDDMNAMERDLVHEPINDGWTLSIYEVTIWPGPAEAWVVIKGNIVVDQLKLTTQAIPEPATLLLLGLGGMGLLRRRREA